MGSERRSVGVNKDVSRDFDVVVLGATGLTGRLVVEQLVGVDHLLRSPDGRRRWAIAGRDRGGLVDVLSDLSLTDVEIIIADLDDQPSLEALTRRAVVVVNMAGPYTAKARNVIAACVDNGASYVDLSGEIPLLRRVIDEFDDSAKDAKVQVVQMAGWEAMPADLTSLIACKRAVQGHSGRDGPGAARPIAEVTVAVEFTLRPSGEIPLNQQVSAGTLASIVEMMDDPNAALIGRPDALLPPPSGPSRNSRPGALRLGLSDVGGRVLAPVPPVAFLNPPIIHRTAALLAAERQVAYFPAAYLEGEDIGSSAGYKSSRRKVQAKLKAAVRLMAMGITRLPLPVRRGVATGVRKILPEAGTGPSGAYLRDWKWTVTATATNEDGTVGTARLDGSGHPGYTATAAIIVEVALSMVDIDATGRKLGCITPALAIGAEIKELRVESLNLS